SRGTAPARETGYSYGDQDEERNENVLKGLGVEERPVEGDEELPHRGDEEERHQGDLLAASYRRDGQRMECRSEQIPQLSHEEGADDKRAEREPDSRGRRRREPESRVDAREVNDERRHPGEKEQRGPDQREEEFLQKARTLAMEHRHRDDFGGDEE